MEAVRFALFAEAVAPELRDANETLAMPSPHDPDARLAVARAKLAAGEAVPELRRLLRLDADG